MPSELVARSLKPQGFSFLATGYRLQATGYRYHETVEPQEQPWQSNLILLIVVPWVTVGVFSDTHGWGRGTAPEVAYWTLGLSALLGLLAWLARSGTFAAAETGALITASLMYGSTLLPYDP